ncbi:LLM class flavin-dependent oxidoreductase [Streptomyces sp. NPDC088812]|uniref:LLM class flavin-dependent oxidoreductase n=1 Tax=Streptomyces sp. NPDC088812 TaxID=3365905 RepID=UPI00382A75AF
MHFSLFLGQAVSGWPHDTAAIDLGIEQAHYADEHGFTAVYSGEQHFNDYEPYGDGLGMSAYFAGQLNNAYVGLSVVPLVVHHPLLFIQRVNLLDQLAKGKSIVGISAGRPLQGAAFHVADLTPPERAALFDAKLDVVERAWAHRPGEKLEFDTGRESGSIGGRSGERIMPYSYRDPHPLYAIGTNTPAKITEAGRSGRLVHLGPFPLRAAADMAALYRRALTEGGADDAAVAHAMSWLIHTKMVMVADTDAEAWDHAEEAFRGPLTTPPWIHPTAEEQGKPLREVWKLPTGPIAPAMGRPESLSAYLHRIIIVGSPGTVAREVAAYGDAGLPHMHLRFAFGSAADPGIYRRSLELFATEVMPKVGSSLIPGPTTDQIRAEYRP